MNVLRIRASARWSLQHSLWASAYMIMSRPQCRYRNRRHLRVFRCRFKWVVLVNLAGHKWQNLVWGRVGILPLWDRILEMLPVLVRATTSGAAVEDEEDISDNSEEACGSCCGSADMVVEMRVENEGVICEITKVTTSAQAPTRLSL